MTFPEAVVTEEQLAQLAEDISDRLAQKLRPMEALLTTQEVAELLKKSDRTVRELIATGELRSFKLEGARRIDPESVREYLEARRDG